MLSILLFTLGIVKGLALVDRSYRWYENLEITIRCLKKWFIVECLKWFALCYMLLLYYMSTILPKEVWNQSIAYFGTLGNGAGFISCIFVLSVFTYGVLKIFTPDERLDYLTGEWCKE